ncbi:unnamed protein product [Paramecium primaurelia]|uniref:RING-type domain-containing protein n=1 Tax=Paramecium primaurelia TaxID=5886 RepID=A0A8S1KH35_PARPR|nr:unnamed protein product [Paramecium primaurelia]
MEDICIICLQNTQNFVIGKSCQCKYCYNCVFDWFEQNPEKLLKQSFNCLNYLCNEPNSIQEFLSSINEQKILDRYNDITFKNYLKSCQDIRACPNKTCKSYGFLPSSRCSEFLECEICNYKWYDKKCLSINKICMLFLKNLKNDFLCFFSEFYYTHQCPNCDTQIMKNGGCNHMTCKSCNHEYCYICRDKHNGHDSKLCSLKDNSFCIVIAYVIIQLLFTLGIHTFLIYIAKQLFYLVCIIFIFAYNLNGKLITICTISTLLDMKYHYDIHRKESVKLYRTQTEKKINWKIFIELIALLVLDLIVILTTTYEDNINKIDSIAIYVIYPVEFLSMLFICFWYK